MRARGKRLFAPLLADPRSLVFEVLPQPVGDGEVGPVFLSVAARAGGALTVVVGQVVAACAGRQVAPVVLRWSVDMEKKL